MKMQGQAVFVGRIWDEKPYLEMDNSAKLTRIRVVQTYTGTWWVRVRVNV